MILNEEISKFRKTLISCRVFSIAGIPVILYFLYHDTAIFGYTELAYPRIIALLIMIFSFFITYFIKESDFKKLKILYTTELTLIMAMSTFVIVQLMLRYKAPIEHISGAIQALMSSIFVVLLFAHSIPENLAIIYSPIFITLPLLLASGAPRKELSYIANPLVLCIVSILIGHLYSKLEREEEKMKALLKQQKEILQETVEKLEYTVQKLNEEIIRRKEVEKQLRELSVKDPLTEVYNRRAAMEFIEKSIREYRKSGKTFSIAYIDLDGLKETNDRFGHEYGDKLIKTFAALLEDNIRKNDMVFRVGGDEFIVLFKDTTEQTVYEIIARIHDLAKIKSRFLPIPISFSYGIATYSKGMSLDEIIALADKRMYKQKNSKKTK